ncbi:MAG: nuclear transport factor 2 family protein [Ilumatobacteraceae bacterium]
MTRSTRLGTLAVLALASIVTGCAGDRAGTAVASDLPGVFRDREATAVALFDTYSDALVAKDEVRLGEILGDEFILQRTNGTWVDRAGFLGRLPDLRSFETSDFTERRGVNVIVARCVATADLSVDGSTYRTTSAPMLVVFEWAEGHWVLQAQGNFNLPQA